MSIEDIINFAKHPAVLLVLGGLVFKIYTDDRIRQAQILDKRIEFLDSTGKILNKVFPLLFSFVRNIELSEDKIKALDDAILSLFQERFSLKVKSVVYFGNNLYSDRYEELCWGISNIFSLLSSLNKKRHKWNNEDPYDITDEINKVESAINSLVADWPLNMDDFKVCGQELNDANSKIFYEWANMLWGRAISLQINTLSSTTENDSNIIINNTVIYIRNTYTKLVAWIATSIKVM
ncbi:MAG: hypothetical protein EPN23_11085 [Verrucomicrobia bacterium]|nr:MAG: hypothetical protein EPN23_11085 [Verrucomicrobiota bacterium]